MIVLGHRGAGWQHDQLPLWQENTLESFQEAKDLNADGIETDVRLYNNQLVLHHDKIEDVPWERNLPTLIDLLEWSDDNFILNLEIKDKDAVAPLIDVIKSYPNKKYIISSFWHKTVHHVKNKLPDIECGLLMSFNPISTTVFKALIPDTIDTVIWDHTIVDQQLIDDMSNLRHMVYGVSSRTLVSNLDGIISDDLNVHAVGLD